MYRLLFKLKKLKWNIINFFKWGWHFRDGYGEGVDYEEIFVAILPILKQIRDNREKYHYNSQHLRALKTCCFLLERAMKDEYRNVNYFGQVISFMGRDALRKKDIDKALNLLTKYYRYWWV